MIFGTGTSYAESIGSTGTYTTLFSLGFGPTMSPPETLVIQGISLDTQILGSLLGMTGSLNGGLWEVRATYQVLNTSGKGDEFPVTATQTCYYGTYNFAA